MSVLIGKKIKIGKYLIWSSPHRMCQMWKQKNRILLFEFQINNNFEYIQFWSLKFKFPHLTGLLCLAGNHKVMTLNHLYNLIYLFLSCYAKDVGNQHFNPLKAVLHSDCMRAWHLISEKLIL